MNHLKVSILKTMFRIKVSTVLSLVLLVFFGKWFFCSVAFYLKLFRQNFEPWTVISIKVIFFFKISKGTC
jgi:hypothetical protein